MSSWDPDIIDKHIHERELLQAEKEGYERALYEKCSRNDYKDLAEHVFESLTGNRTIDVLILMMAFAKVSQAELLDMMAKDRGAV